MMGGAETADEIQKRVPPATLEQLKTVAANPSLTLVESQAQVNAILAPYSIVVTEAEVGIYRDMRYAAYFLNSRSSVVQLETLEITHPNFTKDYRIVRNATAGISVTLETGNNLFFEYFPVKIVPHHARDDLDHSISVTFGDLGEVLPVEMDAVMNAPGGLQIKPTVKYRVYRSDDLAAPLYGPLRLEVEAFTFDKEGATFEAKAPSLNYVRTGEVYSLPRFPALRGFL